MSASTPARRKNHLRTALVGGEGRGRCSAMAAFWQPRTTTRIESNARVIDLADFRAARSSRPA